MSPASGTRLGLYEILSPLGVGGMGEVYRARDTRLERDVALKVLPDAFARDADRMARFEREAKVLASLNHPNIAAIYGFEDSGGAHALIMELVEGPTLAERIAKGPIPLEETLRIARQICEALEYAHERGIVHRDLKPANVKVTNDDAVKVLDFGLAKALEGDAARASDPSNSPTLTRMATQAGIILGTAAYMPPEQARGRTVDRRADIWAFGCVLFEMLTGRIAFGGETVTDTLAAVVMKEPDWSLLPAATPAHVRVLLRRCLQKDPRQRLRDIGDARISVEEVLSNAAESLLTAGIAYPMARRAVPWLAAGLFAGALIGALAFWKMASKPKYSMHFSAVTDFAGIQAQPAISPDDRSLAFVSNRDGHYNIYVGLISGGNLVQITHDPNLKARPAWSPDGATLAYARLNHSGLWDVWEVAALGGAPRRIILNASDPAWSPDGRSLAYESTSSGALWISGISGENARQLAAAPPSAGTPWRDIEPSFSPDGGRIAFITQATGPYGELERVDVASGKVRALTMDRALALSPSWSADGRFIYFASSRGGAMNIWKISAGGGEPRQITAGQGDDAELSVSSDGKRVVFSTWRTNINIAQTDLTAKSPQPGVTLLTTDPGRNQMAPEYSPDGKYIAYFSNLKGAERESVWISSSDGLNAVQLVHDNQVNIFPHWTPDGKQLVYRSEPEGASGANEYRSVPISGGAPATIVTNVTGDFSDVGPDGRLLFLNSEHKVEVFDPHTDKSEILSTFPVHLRWVAFGFSPDGRSIAYVVDPHREDDPGAGLWVDDLKNPPRQLFCGWVLWYVRAPHNEIYLLEGKPDLKAVLWKLNWNGQGLQRTAVTIPMIRSYWADPAQNPQDWFDISPDGQHIAFEVQSVVSANIGMIQNVR
jgi:serine/threonine protein kinase